MLVRQLEEELRMRMRGPSIEMQQQMEVLYQENEHLTREIAILRDTIKVSCVSVCVLLFLGLKFKTKKKSVKFVFCFFCFCPSGWILRNWSCGSKRKSKHYRHATKVSRSCWRCYRTKEWVSVVVVLLFIIFFCFVFVWCRRVMFCG